MAKSQITETIITDWISLHKEELFQIADYIFRHPELELGKCLAGLADIDWSRSNLECWQNRAITDKGRINRNEKGIFLTYVQIKRLLQLTIEPEEAAREKQLL